MSQEHTNTMEFVDWNVVSPMVWIKNTKTGSRKQFDLTTGSINNVPPYFKELGRRYNIPETFLKIYSGITDDDEEIVFGPHISTISINNIKHMFLCSLNDTNKEPPFIDLVVACCGMGT